MKIVMENIHIVGTKLLAKVCLFQISVLGGRVISWLAVLLIAHYETEREKTCSFWIFTTDKRLFA